MLVLEAESCPLKLIIVFIVKGAECGDLFLVSFRLFS